MRNQIRLRTLITTIALLSLLSSAVARAQTTGSAGSSARTASLAPNTRLIGRAPVGHRQPHADDVPPENDVDHLSAEAPQLIARSTIFAAAAEVACV
jgi:hypothetical protein